MHCTHTRRRLHRRKSSSGWKGLTAARRNTFERAYFERYYPRGETTTTTSGRNEPPDAANETGASLLRARRARRTRLFSKEIDRPTKSRTATSPRGRPSAFRFWPRNRGRTRRNFDLPLFLPISEQPRDNCEDCCDNLAVCRFRPRICRLRRIPWTTLKIMVYIFGGCNFYKWFIKLLSNLCVPI